MKSRFQKHQNMFNHYATQLTAQQTFGRLLWTAGGYDGLVYNRALHEVIVHDIT